MMKYDVAVIGGGAAGLMAAGTAGMLGFSVLLIERNKAFGRKLRITGKGRCNVTNNCSVDKVIENTPRNGKFLYGAVNSFTPADLITFFEELGVPLKTERGNRVFPVSDNANDIADTLFKNTRQNGVEFRNGRVTEIAAEDDGTKTVKAGNDIYRARNIIIACGGKSYPGTGSDGDGYRLAKSVGHSITDISPSLVPLVAKGEVCSKLQGLSLKNCKIQVLDKGTGKVVYNDFGELLFTHFGLSGPTVLSASAHMRNMEKGRYSVLIDLKPALDNAVLDTRIIRDFTENKNRFFANSLDGLLPKSMIPVVVELSGIEPEKQCNAITREERQNLVELLKGFKIDIEGFRPINEAIITSGGVNIKEINPKTMESKIVKGLYFAGEVIDVDAYTGGFNLQIAFSTAYCAANSII